MPKDYTVFERHSINYLDKCISMDKVHFKGYIN